VKGLIKRIALRLLGYSYPEKKLNLLAHKKNKKSQEFYGKLIDNFAYLQPRRNTLFFQAHEHCVSFRKPSYWDQYNFIDSVPYPKDGFNPVTVSQYGISVFDHYKKKENKDQLKARLKKLYDKLNEEHPDYYYRFSLDKYNLQPPWQSALALANVLSFYIRYYQVSGEGEEYIEDIVNSLLSNDTFRLKLNDQYTWFEEYPTKDPSLVLNGFISVIIALYEYQLLKEKANVTEVLQSTVNCLLRSMPHFDNGIYLKYDLMYGTPIAEKYYWPHYFKFKQLYVMSGQKEFKIIAKRMRRICLRMTFFHDIISTLYYTRRNHFPYLFNDQTALIAAQYKK
jgi:hypothetical protein